MSSNSSTASANLALDRSKSCRFCTKNLTCIGTKVPRISLYNVVKNKALLTFTGPESLVLADVVESLGHKLLRNNQLSQVSCLNCARTLMRLYATFTKLVGGSNGGILQQFAYWNFSVSKQPCLRMVRHDQQTLEDALRQQKKTQAYLRHRWLITSVKIQILWRVFLFSRMQWILEGMYPPRKVCNSHPWSQRWDFLFCWESSSTNIF